MTQKMGHPILCSAANETYAVGLTVALCSALRHLAATAEETRIYVLDGGIRDSTWLKIDQSLALTGRPFRLIRLRPEMKQFAGLPQDWGSSVMTYARLALSHMVEETRLVYVDADMVVQSDLTALWNTDLHGATVGAAKDITIKVLSAENLPLKELGLPGEDPYLQAGVLVIDLLRWRERKVSERVLQYLREWPQYTRHWDQTALNVVLHRDWMELPSEWNTPAWWADQGIEATSPDAPLLHFVGPHKPWLLGHAVGASANRFYGVLDQTKWAGWRPTEAGFRLKMLKYRFGLFLKKFGLR